MTSNGVRKLISNLAVYYPRSYPPSMTEDRAKALYEDLTKAFAEYKDNDVLKAAYDLHLTSTEGITVADIIGKLYGMKRISDEEYDKPTTWYNYFEDEPDGSGYGYATNSKTKEIDCIWKPRWAKERSFDFNGRHVVLPRKLKTQTLKEHGIVKY